MPRTLLPVERKPFRFTSDHTRVITRPFDFGDDGRVAKLFRRVAALSDAEATEELRGVLTDFSLRHRDIEGVFKEHYERAAGRVPDPPALSREKKLLIGSYLTMEYAIEAAALFNPSIVLAPDQAGLAPGHAHVILSFRATGEGHVSSIDFRGAVLTDENELVLDFICVHPEASEVAHNTFYDKQLFILRLVEMIVPDEAASTPNLTRSDIMNELAAHLPERFTVAELDRALNELRGVGGPLIGIQNPAFPERSDAVLPMLDELPDCFTLAQLMQAMDDVRAAGHYGPEVLDPPFDRLLWVARSNYEVRFDAETCISERIIFPLSDNERRGIEDARFVRFVDESGEPTYYATYTAYDGNRAQTQFLKTQDFLTFRISTLNGRHENTKGMALFPRKVGGRYAMISRVDGENLFLMYSDDVHFWHQAELIQEPQEPWEFVQIGNCGSPIETDEGWLLFTHGVGPMRRYCIGATLLDLDDPSKVICRPSKPLLMPSADEREGYVPNVVYSCGALVHNGTVVLPYAMSDSASSIAMFPLADLLDAMKNE